MRIVRFLTLVLIELTLLVIAINGLLSTWGRFGPDPIRVYLPAYLRLETRPEWLAIWTTVILLLVLHWLSVLALWGRRPRAMQVRTADGDLMLIQSGALAQFARQQVESHPAVVSQKVKVRQTGSRGISVTVWADVQPTQSLPTIKRQLEQSIRDGYSQVLGVEKIDNVTIILNLDRKNMNLRPGPIVEHEPRPEAPVRGTLEERPLSVTVPQPEPRKETFEERPLVLEERPWETGEPLPPSPPPGEEPKAWDETPSAEAEPIPRRENNEDRI